MSEDEGIILKGTRKRVMTERAALGQQQKRKSGQKRARQSGPGAATTQDETSTSAASSSKEPIDAGQGMKGTLLNYGKEIRG